MSSKPNFRPPPYQDVAAERGQGLLTGAWFQMGNDRNGGAKRKFVVTPPNGGFWLSATRRPQIRKIFPERLSGASCSPCQGPASSTSPSSRLDFFAHESIAVGEARRGGLTVAAPALPGHGLSSVRAPDRPVSEPKEKVHGKACKEKPDRRRHRR